MYEPYTDLLSRNLELEKNEKAFRIEAHKGQFNQREDSSNEIIKRFIDLDIKVNHSKIFVFKNINDEAYIKQLNGYKDYIEKLFNKKTSIYLYSITLNTLEEIK